MIQNVIDALFGSKHEADLKKLLPILHEVNELESWAVGLSESDIKQKTAEFRGRLQKGESSADELLPEAYAMVREANRRGAPDNVTVAFLTIREDTGSS